MCDKIQLPYQVILKRFWVNSDIGGRLDSKKARDLLVVKFRMGKDISFRILKEMKDLGFLLELNHKNLVLSSEVVESLI